jgi:long-chain fatty acid transport protein
MFRILFIAFGLLLNITIWNIGAAVIFKTDLISPRFLGYGQAGTAATVGDASSNYFNPAALTEIGHMQVVFGGTGLYQATRLNIESASTTYSSNIQSGLPEQTKPNASFLTGSLFLSMPLMEDWVLGLGVASPFRYHAKYSTESAGRYQAELFDLNSYQIFPTLAVKLTDKFSVGAGFDILKTILKYNVSRGFSGASDGYYYVQAEDWSTGYHVGILYQVAPECRLGITYFSAFKLHLTGTANSQNPSRPFTVNPGIAFNNEADIKFYLPESVVYSIAYDIDAQWALMSDLEWTHWSRFKQLSIDLNNKQNWTQTFDFKNKLRVAFGGHYRINTCWLMRGGLTWEESPVQSRYRNLLVSEANQMWASVGLEYDYVKSGLKIDLGYRYGFSKNKTINSTPESSSLSGPNTASSEFFLLGDIKSNKHVLGIQLSLSMC